MVIKSVNLALRFSLEICALISMGYWGFKSGNGQLMKIVLGLGIPLIAALVWGVFGSPAAPVVLPKPLHLMLELAIFGLACILLYASGYRFLALAFGMILVINRILIYIMREM